MSAAAETLSEEELRAFLDGLDGEPIVVEDDPIAALLNPAKAPKGMAWHLALERIAEERTEAAPAAVRLSSTAELNLAATERDAGRALDEVLRTLPGARVVLATERSLIDAALDEKHPLRAETRAILKETGIDDETVERDMELIFAPAVPKASLVPLPLAERRDDGRNAYLLRSVSGLRPRREGGSRREQIIASGRPKPDGWLDGNDDRDVEAIVAFINDHELAHLSSRLLSERSSRREDAFIGAKPSDAELLAAHRQECIADGAAILRSAQRFGPDRAERLAREVSRLRNEGLVLDGDAEHWTAPTMIDAVEEAVFLSAADALNGVGFVELVRHARASVLGVSKEAPKLPGTRREWRSVDAETLARLPDAIAERLNGNATRNDDRPLDDDERRLGETVERALLGYVSGRLDAPSEIAARDETFHERILPSLDALFEGVVRLQLAAIGPARKSSTEAVAAMSLICSGIERIAGAHAKDGRQDPESALSCVRKARGLGLAVAKAGRSGTGSAIADFVAKFPEKLGSVVEALPEGLGGLRSVPKIIRKDAEGARRRMEGRIQIANRTHLRTEDGEAGWRGHTSG
jgi:hypothetical protein